MSQQKVGFLFPLDLSCEQKQKGNVPFVRLNMKRKEKKHTRTHLYITIYFDARWMRALEINIIHSIPRAECEIHCGNICCRTHFWLCTPTRQTRVYNIYIYWPSMAIPCVWARCCAVLSCFLSHLRCFTTPSFFLEFSGADFEFFFHFFPLSLSLSHFLWALYWKH